MRATFAALYALGVTVPEEGILVKSLCTTLASHIDKETFVGLLHELQRRRVITLATTTFGRLIQRGPEYTDGLERLRLSAQAIR